MEPVATQSEQTMNTSKGFLTNLVSNEGRARRMVRESGILGALIILIVVGAIISPHFLKTANLINVIRQIAIVGIIGMRSRSCTTPRDMRRSRGASIAQLNVV
jgi:ribose/xylose/arabinose/galactoside ABC-type transport system permease subunit